MESLHFFIEPKTSSSTPLLKEPSIVSIVYIYIYNFYQHSVTFSILSNMQNQRPINVQPKPSSNHFDFTATLNITMSKRAQEEEKLKKSTDLHTASAKLAHNKHKKH